MLRNRKTQKQLKKPMHSCRMSPEECWRVFYDLSTSDGGDRVICREGVSRRVFTGRLTALSFVPERKVFIDGCWYDIHQLDYVQAVI